MLIGIHAPAPLCGKSTVAKHLLEEGFVIVSFAGPLKRMLISFLMDLGYDESEARRLIYFDKHEIIPEVGVNSRHLQRTLGTEWGRQCVHPDVWIKTWEAGYRAAKAAGHEDIAVDDLRHVNEWDCILRHQGLVWTLDSHREGFVKEVTEHGSEGELDACEAWDGRIDNDGSLEDLYEQVIALLNVSREALK